VRDPYSFTDLGHKLHGNIVKKGCIVVKVEVLKHDAKVREIPRLG